MPLKTCFKCHAEKDTSDFYRHSKMGDGFLNKCKVCTKTDVAEHRTLNLEKIRKYDRDRASLPHRRANAARVAAGWRARGPAARSAQSLVHHAYIDGRLVKGLCEVCGIENVHAHHDDYLKPLDVRWLCAAHHRQHHRDNGPGLNADAVIPLRRMKRGEKTMPTEIKLCA